MKWYTNSWKCKLFKSNKKIQHFSVKLKWYQILKSILKCAVSCVETQKLDLCCCCCFFVSYFLLQNNSRVCLCAWWSKKYFKIRKRTRTYLGFLPSLAVKLWCSFFLNRETFFYSISQKYKYLHWWFVKTGKEKSWEIFSAFQIHKNISCKVFCIFMGHTNT